MEQDLVIQPNLVIPGRELWATASLSGGKGGQHVNKVSSRITLYWQVVASVAISDFQKDLIQKKLAHRISQDGVLQVSASSHRSQHRNREEARARLATLVQNALKRPVRRIPTKATLASKRRRLDDKKRQSLMKKRRKSPVSWSD